MGVFNWPNAEWAECGENQFNSIPGQVDRMDNDSRSAVMEGGPGVYGRVMVRGVSSPKAGDAGRGYTKCDSASLPDAAGAHLQDGDGQTYADAGIALPVDADGNLIPLGIGQFCECCPKVKSLAEPFGFEDAHYVDEGCMITIPTEGNISAFTETDINIDDDLYFRTVITAPGQILGAFRNDDDGGNAQRFKLGNVFRPGAAGAAFVVHLNSSNL